MLLRDTITWQGILQTTNESGKYRKDKRIQKKTLVDDVDVMNNCYLFLIVHITAKRKISTVH